MSFFLSFTDELLKVAQDFANVRSRAGQAFASLDRELARRRPQTPTMRPPSPKPVAPRPTPAPTVRPKPTVTPAGPKLMPKKDPKAVARSVLMGPQPLGRDKSGKMRWSKGAVTEPTPGQKRVIRGEKREARGILKKIDPKIKPHKDTGSAILAAKRATAKTMARFKAKPGTKKETHEVRGFLSKYLKKDKGYTRKQMGLKPKRTRPPSGPKWERPRSRMMQVPDVSRIKLKGDTGPASGQSAAAKAARAAKIREAQRAADKRTKSLIPNWGLTRRSI